MNKQTSQTSDIVIVGGGPTGLAAALECASKGFSVINLAPSVSHVETDARTTALMVPSLQLLKNHGVWEDCEPHAEALRTLRIIDDTGRLFRAPTIDFQAHEIGEEAFGYNIPNRVLTLALSKAIAASVHITQMDAMVSAVSYEDDIARVVLSNGGEIECKLVIGADGANSIVRQSAGVEQRKWDYPQTACVLAFDHERAHENISTEFHTPFGPFTQVPLPGNRSSLVWVRRPEDAQGFMQLDDLQICKLVEGQMQSLLGKISNPTRPQTWPLSSAVANSFSADRMILLGQAAHVFPPIGAQGLNLGFRDVSDLGAALSKAEGDAGSSLVTSTYDRKRRLDVYLRTGAVDVLNRSLLSGFAPLHMGRAFGMGILKNIAPARSLLMREGILPGSTISGIFKTSRRNKMA